MGVLADLFQDNKFSTEDLSGFENKLFFEGPRQRPFLVKFFVLVFLSTIIAVYGVSRDDIADSLPGVAIAISLVPPLCVVGISLSQSQWDAAWGSMLLFMTNFLAILLAGGGVLALLGLGRAATKTLTASARRNAFYVIGLGVLLVTIPLTATSIRVARDSWTQSRTIQVMDSWLKGTQYSLHDVRLAENGITVVIAGKGPPPSIAELRGKLREKKSGPGLVEIQIVPIDIVQIELSDQAID